MTRQAYVPVTDGVRRTPSGTLEARIRAGGRMNYRTFPLGTSIETAVLWRQHTAESLGRGRKPRPHELPLERSINGWCYIYIIKQGNCVKLGRATDVKSRMSQLQTASAHRLHLVIAFAAHAKMETELQKRFAPYHASGEWFIYGPEISWFVTEVGHRGNPVEVLFKWDRELAKRAKAEAAEAATDAAAIEAHEREMGLES